MVTSEEIKKMIEAIKECVNKDEFSKNQLAPSTHGKAVDSVIKGKATDKTVEKVYSRLLELRKTAKESQQESQQESLLQRIATLEQANLALQKKVDDLEKENSILRSNQTMENQTQKQTSDNERIATLEQVMNAKFTSLEESMKELQSKISLITTNATQEEKKKIKLNRFGFSVYTNSIGFVYAVKNKGDGKGTFSICIGKVEKVDESMIDAKIKAFCEKNKIPLDK